MIANILDGLVLGLQFGLLATGLTLVYGLGGVLNMAYGQIAVVSAISISLLIDAGLPVILAIIYHRLPRPESESKALQVGTAT